MLQQNITWLDIVGFFILEIWRKRKIYLAHLFEKEHCRLTQNHFVLIDSQ